MRYRKMLLWTLCLALCAALAVVETGLAESLTENLATFATPQDGDTFPAGRIEVGWRYSSAGVTGIATKTAANYVTYFVVMKDGEVVKDETIEKKNIDFSAIYDYGRILLKEPGVYTFSLATAGGVDAPDTVTVTVTEPLRSGTCGNHLSWTVDEQGTLTISGYGAMEDWGASGSYVPWEVFEDEIQRAVVGDEVDNIGAYALNDSGSLKEVCLGEGIRTIGEAAFLWCDRLPSVWLPEGVQVIGKNAFDYCEAMTYIYIPASVTQIGDYAFHKCGRLAHVYYGGTQAQWDAISVGEGNSPLSRAELHCGNGPATEERPLHLPDDLVEIQESAFAGDAFTHVYLGGAVRSIGARAFANCAKLVYISIPASTTGIAEDAFDGCPRVVIGCKANSAAYRYAVEHGLAYQLE